MTGTLHAAPDALAFADYRRYRGPLPRLRLILQHGAMEARIPRGKGAWVGVVLPDGLRVAACLDHRADLDDPDYFYCLSRWHRDVTPQDVGRVRRAFALPPNAYTLHQRRVVGDWLVYVLEPRR